MADHRESSPHPPTRKLDPTVLARAGTELRKAANAPKRWYVIGVTIAIVISLLGSGVAIVVAVDATTQDRNAARSVRADQGRQALDVANGDLARARLNPVPVPGPTETADEVWARVAEARSYLRFVQQLRAGQITQIVAPRVGQPFTVPEPRDLRAGVTTDGRILLPDGATIDAPPGSRAAGPSNSAAAGSSGVGGIAVPTPDGGSVTIRPVPPADPPRTTTPPRPGGGGGSTPAPTRRPLLSVEVNPPRLPIVGRLPDVRLPLG